MLSQTAVVWFTFLRKHQAAFQRCCTILPSATSERSTLCRLPAFGSVMAFHSKQDLGFLIPGESSEGLTET